MVSIEGEIVIDRPLDAVFDFVADARNEPRYNPRMLRAEKLSPGPVGLGTRFRDEVQSLRRPTAITIEITGYERPRQLTLSIQMPMTGIVGTLAFDPVPQGTRMRWSWDVEPRGALKLMGPVVAYLGSRQERRIWASLKRYLEAQPAPSPVGASQDDA